MNGDLESRREEAATAAEQGYTVGRPLLAAERIEEGEPVYIDQTTRRAYRTPRAAANAECDNHAKRDKLADATIAVLQAREHQWSIRVERELNACLDGRSPQFTREVSIELNCRDARGNVTASLRGGMLGNTIQVHAGTVEIEGC